MITIKKEGRRFYLVGNTFQFKEEIKSSGCKWDASEKAWWTGKEAVAIKIQKQAENGGDKKEENEDLSRVTIAGKASYKGKTYYVAGKVSRSRNYDNVSPISSKEGKLKLISFDAKISFWAFAEITKSYSSPKTIQGLREFAKRAKEEGEGYLSPGLREAKRYGWDGIIGSSSYYSSGAFDELDI